MFDVKFITTYTNYFTARSQMIGITYKSSERCLFFFKTSASRDIRKTGGKIWLTYDERLKRLEMMIRKNNEINNERINNDIDHNNGVII